jgi:beta-galactosidase
MNAMGQWHPEEYQNTFHELSYSIIMKHPELWATYVWAMFDFGSDGRNEGNNPGINDKGLVTFDRKIKKDAFYFYKAQWNKAEPFVYITSRRYIGRKERITPIKVYSNLKKVTLTVNGKNYGQGRLQQSGVYSWDHVELKSSGNVVAASAKDANGINVKDDVLTWVVK